MTSRKFREIPRKFHQNQNENDQFQSKLAKSENPEILRKKIYITRNFDYGAVRRKSKSCRSRKMLQNDPLVAIVAVDTAENEPLKV